MHAYRDAHSSVVGHTIRPQISDKLQTTRGECIVRKAIFILSLCSFYFVYVFLNSQEMGPKKRLSMKTMTDIEKLVVDEKQRLGKKSAVTTGDGKEAKKFRAQAAAAVAAAAGTGSGSKSPAKIAPEASCVIEIGDDGPARKASVVDEINIPYILGLIAKSAVGRRRGLSFASVCK